MGLKRLLLLSTGVLLALASPASADPGPSDEVVVIEGDCEDGTTVVSAHNTTQKTLGYLIRVGPSQGSARIVEEGTLAPGQRVERTFDVPLGESRFFRIRLGVQGDGVYFSDEGTTDRTNCPTPTTPPPTTSTPPPTTTSTPPPTTSTPPPTVGGGGGTNTGGPTVGGVSGTSPATLAFTGPEDDAPWLIAATIAFLVAGTLALRLASSRQKPASAGGRR
jgi:hypothetical protein